MRLRANPVWDLFRRRTFSQLAYWSVVLGYDPRDRSLTNRFYFIYFILFWGAWAAAVFFGLGSALAGYLAGLPGISPTDLAVLAGAFSFAAWGMVQLWQVTGRSPFIFTEADAYLLCQTPVERRSVGLAWFLMDWFGAVLPFAAGAILFSFTLVEFSRPGVFSYPVLASYFSSSLRALAVVLPLHLGIQAGLWGLGAFRLRRDRPPEWLPWLRLVSLPAGFCLLAAAFLPEWRGVFLAPLTFPLQAAFNAALPAAAWWVREGFALVVPALGLGGLVLWAGRIHLGRAAQETRLQAVIRLANSTMNYDLAEIIRYRERMATTHPPSRLPVHSGGWMIAWKDLLQSQRSIRLAQVLRWVGVFFLAVGMLLPINWTGRLLVGGAWAVTLGSLTTRRLRTDLARWWLLRSLPLRTPGVLLAELGPSCGLGILLSWIAVGLAGSSSSTWIYVLLIPFLAANAVLGTARDILDHARTRVLMTPSLAEENVPRQDVQGALGSLIAVGVPLGILIWSDVHTGGLLWGWFSLPAAALIMILYFQSVVTAYRWIR